MQSPEPKNLSDKELLKIVCETPPWVLQKDFIDACEVEMNRRNLLADTQSGQQGEK